MGSEGLPKICPHGRCTDPVLANAKPSLVAMFKQYEKLIKKHGFGSKTVLWNQSFSIHLELERLNMCGSWSQVMRTNGWPSNIVFQDLPTRIMAMRRELRDLIFVKGFSGTGLVQNEFRALLDRAGFGSPPNISRLARAKLPPSIVFDASRPG